MLSCQCGMFRQQVFSVSKRIADNLANMYTLEYKANSPRSAPEAVKQCFSAAHCEAYLYKQCFSAVHYETCLNKQC